MKPYPLVDDPVRTVLRVGMSQAQRLIAPRGPEAPSAPWEARRSGNSTSPAGGDAKVFSSLRESKHVEIERASVPFYGPGSRWTAITPATLLGLAAGTPFATIFATATRVRPDAPAAAVTSVNMCGNFTVTGSNSICRARTT